MEGFDCVLVGCWNCNTSPSFDIALQRSPPEKMSSPILTLLTVNWNIVCPQHGRLTVVVELPALLPPRLSHPDPQIENKYLLDKFQRAGKVKDSCKVKGLFCHVPDDSLEHVVLYGMGGGVRGDGGGGTVDADTATHRYDWDGDPIDLIWTNKGTSLRERAEIGGGGAASLRCHTTAANNRRATADGGVRLAKPLVFPRLFSRYGTLEEEREYANRAEEERGVRTGLSSPLVVTSTAPRPDSRPGQRRAGDEGRGREEGAVSGLRLLALCRVMIGSMCVSPSPSANRGAGGGLQPAGNTRGSLSTAQGDSFLCPPLPSPPPGQAEFDSVYFPREEEYLLLNETFVLPEFLVVHRFAAGTQNTPSSAAWTGSVSPSSGADTAVATSTAAAAVAASGDGNGISFVGGTGEMERVDGRRRKERVSCNPLHAATPSAPPFQNAASVVAGIEAAMRPVRSSLTSKSSAAIPTLASDGSSASARTATSEVVGTDSLPTMIGSDAGFIVGKDGRRRRERGSGRASLDPIVRSVELECESCRRSPSGLARRRHFCFVVLCGSLEDRVPFLSPLTDGFFKEGA